VVTVSASKAYDNAVRTAADCIHGVQGGDIVRPWTAKPACALCRRRHPVHWITIGERAPRPRNVIDITGSRRLF
jgi:hypothetical protein